MNKGFVPYQTITHLLQNWWKILVISILVGLLGLTLSFFQKPKYEAEAIFYATIDYRDINFEGLINNETGEPLGFSQYDADLALSVVQTILYKVKNDAFEYAQTLDPTLDEQTFNDNMMIERLHAEWFLKYRHEDPAVAQSIVNYWAQRGMEELKKAQQEELIEPYVMVDLAALAYLPQDPVYQNREWIVLASMLIGFAGGILFVDVRYRYLLENRTE